MPLELRLWYRVDIRGPDDCWPWLGGLVRGYGSLKKGPQNVYAHRLAYELEIGPIRKGMFICHRCDNPRCCNPAHLFQGTNLTNMSDAARKNRMPHGENHYGMKLTTADVAAIRASTGPAHIVAAKYGVSFGLICGIRRGTKRQK